jgi:hypothetical protein
VPNNRHRIGSALVCALAVAALTGGCTGSGTTRSAPGSKASASAVGGTSHKGTQSAPQSSATDLTSTGTTFERSLVTFRNQHNRYPEAVTLEDGNRLDLTGRRGVTTVIEDDRLTDGVTLDWYRTYSDSRLGRLGAGKGEKAAFSYCMSVAGEHRHVTANPAVSNQTEDKGGCPAPPAEPRG